MKLNGNTILITGGATGIGFALAEAFAKEGNDIIICGRREQKLKEAKSKLPQIHTRVCDLSKEKEREGLYNWVKSNFKGINVLVNNAGIQRMIDFKKGISNLTDGENEIDINLTAPIYLSAYFIPELLKQKESAIINVSSALGFVPIAFMPVYCATKAAIHSFSLSIRHQLRNTSIKVFEVIPPTVDTELDKGARDERGQVEKGIPPAEVAKATLKALEKNEYETAIGMAQNLRMGARDNPEQIFQSINQ
ncbi:L-rhamnose 1-dehydrogenase (NADP(+)) [uncultured archaeon]|nr:L-rhamnose 1-dehydrogenase (NADP(+)) [uncultured archaeon]